jgi:manganese transport protein
MGRRSPPVHERLKVTIEDIATSAKDHATPFRTGKARASLGEHNSSVPVPALASNMKKFLAFAGPGYLVSVGYMDPGNWATSITGGSQFGYTLLSVILLSNLMAIVLQALAARLGIATGLDLAQACRAHYPRSLNMVLFGACQLAIIACDLAEVIGTAIALKLLFGIPLVWGCLITALDAFFVLMLMQKGFRWLEAFIIVLILTITACFIFEIAVSAPSLREMGSSLLGAGELARNPAMLYIAIGIIGATVMPHNLYLHSSIVQTRAYERNVTGRREAIRWATIDSTLALMLALFVNGAILVLAASVFYKTGRTDVADIEQAYELLAPALGIGLAATLFGVALLASGLNSTVTGTLAGQIVMEGFLDLRMRPWVQRLMTRGAAILPVLVVSALYGDDGTTRLLILSQVILSMQLPFAIIPLVQFVSSRKTMGPFAISRAHGALAWAIAGLIVALNVKLLYDTVFG